jgi:hypothetical protein
MEKVSWADLVRNKEILNTIKEERTMLRTVKRRKGKWMATSCVEIALKNTLFKKGIWEGKMRKKA